ncbi:MAG: DNA cytosine methyltransferase [Piscinibacter sp.]|uniref:DNA cytosine methyltransferase n=1 Tax=Piscinibacter sp. TaxID=1903157 RepID=UPI002587A2BE|nr:DNA cytosine methyltransferase [Piscinibacter sp.]MCW5665457.1 DNA cytosine methyltransferase [Piscinibacter sp.]
MENYYFESNRVIRELRVGERVWRSGIENRARQEQDGYSAWWQSFLRGAPVFVEDCNATSEPIRVVDAFCGCGGLTLGAAQAAIAVGRRIEAVAAIDVDDGGLEVHKANFGTKHVLHTSASSLVDFHVSGTGVDSKFAYEPEVTDPALASEVGKIDLFLAGPPCQGHSNLNNRTRREDPRNLLYLTAVALAVGLKAKMVVIENVPEVVNDRSDVVTAAKALLRANGYDFLDSGVLAAHEMGWAQTRKRYFLVASRRGGSPDQLTLKSVAAGLKREAHSLGWAIGDLIRDIEDPVPTGVMDTVPALSEENRARIGYLFKHDVYELPNQERPDCHKDGHTYPSVYGRMYWSKPAQTITTGFLTPGRGRYIHPARPRVITPREAARIQAFPDSFRFVVNGHDPARNALTKWIGDAVPPVLGYAAVLPLLATR